MRRHDPRSLLGEIYRAGPISRAELAQTSGSAPSYIGNTVGELQTGGFVVEVGLAPSKLGRRRVLVEVNPDLAHLIGVDIGTANIRMISTDLGGRILASKKMPSEIGGGANLVIESISGEIARFLAMDPLIKGIGVAHSGLIDRAGGIVLLWPKVRGWDNTPLRQILRDKFHLPLTVEDSTRAMALAEQRYGQGVGVKDFVYVSIGMGLGSAIFINGQLYVGGGLAGELGHVTLDEQGDLCSCGNRGCLEVYSSGSAIISRVRLGLQRGVSSSLSNLDHEPFDQLTIEAIVNAAASHDRLSETVLTEAAAHLGTALAGIVNLLHPQKIILGAAVPQAAKELFLAPVKQCLCRRAFRQSASSVEVAVSQLGGESAALGVALLIGESVLDAIYGASVPARKVASGSDPNSVLTGFKESISNG